MCLNVTAKAARGAAGSSDERHRRRTARCQRLLPSGRPWNRGDGVQTRGDAIKENRCGIRTGLRFLSRLFYGREKPQHLWFCSAVKPDVGLCHAEVFGSRTSLAVKLNLKPRGNRHQIPGYDCAGAHFPLELFGFGRDMGSRFCCQTTGPKALPVSSRSLGRAPKDTMKFKARSFIFATAGAPDSTEPGRPGGSRERGHRP